MQLRTRIGLLLGASVLASALAFVVAAREFRTMELTAHSTEKAQDALLEARALLILTYEYALHGQPRSAQQWRLRYEALTLDLKASSENPAVTGAPDLAAELSALAGLFDKLVQARQDGPPDSLSSRRIDLLTDSLIDDTQTILDSTYVWVTSLSAQRTVSERYLAALAVSIPIIVIATLGLLGMWLTRRVTQPLRQLQQLMSAVAGADLTVRSRNANEDEIGDLSRSFDAMTTALQQALAERVSSEKQMRLIADSLPARIARFNKDQCLIYANQAACAVLGAQGEAQLLGKSLRQLQPSIYGQFEPHIEKVLQGQPQSFLVSKASDEAGPIWSSVALIPDRADDGGTQGWYAMIQDITESVRSRQKMQVALEEKETLLREVHHRVKNNMQVITSLLALQAGQTQNPELQSILEECRNRIRSMALIHEKLYQNAKLSAIDFGDYIRTLVQMMASSQANQTITTHVEAVDVKLNINRAVPAGLIVNELVSNSFKHGFPDRRPGHINVKLLRLPNQLAQLSLSDDGVGAPASKLMSDQTLGLRLVRLLAGQLDAELEFGQGPGFSCVLKFPTEHPTEDEEEHA